MPDAGNPPARKRPNKKLLLGVWLALLACLVAAIAVGNRFVDPKGGSPGTPKPVAFPKMDAAKMTAQWPQIVAHAAAPARGNPAAPYTIAEFGDFQCPQCGKVRPELETLLSKYPAQVNLVFIHRPFPQMHQWANSAGAASEIAAAHGKFWPMYDVLYAHQDDLETGFYSDYSGMAGLDKMQFKKAFDAGQGQEKVKAAAAFADSLGIQETPTLLLHNNATGTTTVYVGLDGTKNADNSPQYPGVKELLARPPWGG